MTITKEDLDQLLGGAKAVGVQVVFTSVDPDNESIAMCERHEADHVSLYLRLENGEVVPVRDVSYKPTGTREETDVSLIATANHLAEIWKHLGELPLETNGALS